MPYVPRSRRPTQRELAAAEGREIPDIIGLGLAVLFCGINPGLYSGATGHHFAKPGNRFWKALHGAGFTDDVVHPYDAATLLPLRLGLTNLVARTTRAAADLDDHELRGGGRTLESKVRQYEPGCVAVLGIGAYRKAFARPRAKVGPQPETLGNARLWVLPNPSGLNAHFQLPDLVEEFSKLRAETRA